IAAADNRGVHIFGSAGVNIGASDVTLLTILTPGVNTFTAKYRVSSGSGRISSRRLMVIPFEEGGAPMAWSAPMTAVSGSVFTAAQFNQFVRDNLNETAPARATTAGAHFV